MSTAILPENLAFSLIQSQEEFPVNFDDTWQWLGYTRKDSAKETLVRNFEEGLDFSLRQMAESDNHEGFSPQEKAVASRKEQIFLTVECFKSLGMMANTTKGKAVRRYFLECERKLKQILTNPTVTLPAPAPEPPESPTALPESKQKRLDAKITILQSFDAFQQQKQLGFCNAAKAFCEPTNYPTAVPAWVLEIHPELSWQSLRRWKYCLKKKGQKALTDNYGQNKGKTHFIKHPEQAAFAAQYLSISPASTAADLHQALQTAFPNQAPSYDIVRRWCNGSKAANSLSLAASAA